MPILETQLNARSADFQANAQAMRAGRRPARPDRQGGDGWRRAARAKHTARGKLLPRDRVHNLLDAGTPSWNSRPWRRWACTRKKTAKVGRKTRAERRGLIAGIGRVSGRGLHDCVQRRHREGRHLLPASPSRSTCARRKLPSKTA
jgi:3-methylcrotonyl-CoA carboxylase beta subunit